jgi:hypothetical protein
LGNILGEVRVTNHRVRNPDRRGELLAKERFETIRHSVILGPSYDPSFSPHHLYSTARSDFVTRAGKELLRASTHHARSQAVTRPCSARTLAR